MCIPAYLGPTFKCLYGYKCGKIALKRRGTILSRLICIKLYLVRPNLIMAYLIPIWLNKSISEIG
jgi:hypothetical protein